MSIPLPNPSSAPSNVTSLVDRRLLHETVIDQLRDLIVQGELAPETELNERVLAERLGTSRTPLREAIKFLASEGLVELLPNRGAVVAPLKPEKMKEVFVVLGALEALAGDLACRNATDEDIAEIRALHFHMLAHHARGDLAGDGYGGAQMIARDHLDAYPGCPAARYRLDGFLPRRVYHALQANEAQSPGHSGMFKRFLAERALAPGKG